MSSERTRAIIGDIGLVLSIIGLVTSICVAVS